MDKRKCTGHKFTENFVPIEKGFVECQKCKGVVEAFSDTTYAGRFLREGKKGKIIIWIHVIAQAQMKLQVKCVACGYGHPDAKFIRKEKDWECTINDGSEYENCPNCGKKFLYLF